MRGILEGMGLTFSHLFRPKVTRLYPYEKPKLPARSRGLIQLITEEGLKREFNLKCESCLLCALRVQLLSSTSRRIALCSATGSNRISATVPRSLRRARSLPLQAHRKQASM